MNKTGNNVKLLNGTQSASSFVLLSRQLITSGSVFGSGSMTSGNDAIIVNELKKLMGAIQRYLVQYVGYLAGDLASLPPNINASVMQMLSTTFFNLRKPLLLSTIYEDYRVFASSLIPAFQNISTQVSNCQAAQSQLNAALQKASILDDIQKLQEYIKGLKKNYAVIPDQDVSVPFATIKEPYKTYIKMFGFPEGMLWEPDKIAFVDEYLKVQAL